MSTGKAQLSVREMDTGLGRNRLGRIGRLFS